MTAPLSAERVEELRVFLLTLNNEGWKPGRATWGDDVSDLLAILSDYSAIRAAISKGVEWERRYSELVEDVSRRTDQARTMEVKK
jgi:hypothetical protein